MNARPAPLQLPALSPNSYSALALAVFRAEADEEVAGSFFAAVAYIRAAASRAGVPVRQACQDLAQRPGRPAP